MIPWRMSTKPTPPLLDPTTQEGILLAAARRVTAARANPKMEYGQSKAMDDMSFALDDLAVAVANIDNGIPATPTFGLG